ncbi:MAG: hypothetical protein IKR52_05720 [Paludibacteraceae bacterium]|nr:hypothetical protein [Paludibacteraceae bacterium]
MLGFCSAAALYLLLKKKENAPAVSGMGGKKAVGNPTASVVKSLSQLRGSRPIHNRCTSHKGNMRPTASASGQALRP